MLRLQAGKKMHNYHSHVHIRVMTFYSIHVASNSLELSLFSYADPWPEAGLLLRPHLSDDLKCITSRHSLSTKSWVFISLL